MAVQGYSLSLQRRHGGFLRRWGFCKFSEKRNHFLRFNELFGISERFSWESSGGGQYRFSYKIDISDKSMQDNKQDNEQDENEVIGS